MRITKAGFVFTVLSALVVLPTQAAPVTFHAVGNPDVSGFITFDNAFFPGGTLDFVSNTAITDLSITAFGATFTLADVVTGDQTIVNVKRFAASRRTGYVFAVGRPGRYFEIIGHRARGELALVPAIRVRDHQNTFVPRLANKCHAAAVGG